MRILTAEDVRSAVSMTEAIEAVRQGFIALSEGRAVVPLRGVLPLTGGVTLSMPGYVEAGDFATIKIVSVFSGNAQRDLPTIHAKILVLDAKTGVPVVMMDGAFLTALRTGAGSGVATDLLARPDARILGVIGSGVQARTQIEAVRAVRQIEEVRVYSPNKAHILADELREEGTVKVSVASSASEALAGADVIVAATNSSEPVVNEVDVASGTHINGVGSFTPEMQEVAAGVVLKAKVVVDHYEGAWSEAGDLIIPRDNGLISQDHVYGEIGEVAAGKKAGRTDQEEITFFKSVGNAVQDVVVASRVAAVAEERGLGTVAK